MARDQWLRERRFEVYSAFIQVSTQRWCNIDRGYSAWRQADNGGDGTAWHFGEGDQLLGIFKAALAADPALRVQLLGEVYRVAMVASSKGMTDGETLEWQARAVEFALDVNLEQLNYLPRDSGNRDYRGPGHQLGQSLSHTHGLIERFAFEANYEMSPTTAPRRQR
jgi:hypothetical protein